MVMMGVVSSMAVSGAETSGPDPLLSDFLFTEILMVSICVEKFQPTLAKGPMVANWVWINGRRGAIICQGFDCFDGTIRSPKEIWPVNISS